MTKGGARGPPGVKFDTNLCQKARFLFVDPEVKSVQPGLRTLLESAAATPGSMLRLAGKLKLMKKEYGEHL